MTHDYRAERADLLVGADKSRLMNSLIGFLLEAEDLARNGRNIEIQKGGEVDMFEHTIAGDEFGSFRSACLVGDNILQVFINLEVIMAVVIRNLGKNYLTVVIA